MNRFPDKDTWDKIAADAFSSESVHEFSETYNRKKAEILDGTYEERFSEKRRQRIAVSAFSAVCAAAAGICIFTNMHTRIPEDSTLMLDNSSVSETENSKKENNNSNVPAETSAVNVSEKYEITEKSEFSETIRITEKESERESDTQPAVTEAPSVFQAPSVHNTAAVTTVMENNSVKPPVTTCDEPEMTVPATEITEPVFSDKEELTMRKELASALALLMAYSSVSGGVIHGAEIIAEDEMNSESSAAVYIDENKDLMDFNGDGKFDGTDIYALYAYINERECVPEQHAERIGQNADVTKDGEVSIEDLNMFLGYSLANMSPEERNAFCNDDGTCVPEYGSDELKYNFLKKINNADIPDRFNIPVYRSFCKKTDSGEVSLDVNKDGKADFTDAYKLFLYYFGYKSDTGKIMRFDAEPQTIVQTIPLDVPDLDDITECADKIGKALGRDSEYPAFYTDDYDMILRYIIEHNDITEKDLDIKTYEEMYSFEYDDVYLGRLLTMEEIFLSKLSDVLTVSIKDNTEHNFSVQKGEYIYDMFDDHAEIHRYIGNEENLVIPAEYNGLPVTGIQERAMADHTELKSVVFPDTLKVIGAGAFAFCDNLAEARLPEGLQELGVGAFSGCFRMKEVIIPKGITRLSTDAFSGCFDAYKLELPEGLKEIGEASLSSGSYTEIIIPEGVETIEDQAFIYSDFLLSVTIPASVKNIGENILALYDYDTGEFIPNGRAVIKGYTGSEAEAYANANGIKFIALDSDVNPEASADQPKPSKQTGLSAGDINGDGIADVTDLSWISLSLIGEKELTEEQKAAADVDKDGSVKLNDLARFRQFLSKVIEAF